MAPGIYRESVRVTTPSLTIRGLDRNTTILDGGFELVHGIQVVGFWTNELGGASDQLLYVLAYDDLDEALALQNGVPQGLASSIFTTDLREAERFLADQ